MSTEDNSEQVTKFNLTSPQIILAGNKMQMRSPQF